MRLQKSLDTLYKISFYTSSQKASERKMHSDTFGEIIKNVVIITLVSLSLVEHPAREHIHSVKVILDLAPHKYDP